MPKPTARRFAMADLMILVAGVAAAITWTGALFRNSFESMLDTDFTQDNLWMVLLPNLIRLTFPALASISLALLACQLRPPRPQLRRLARQPGPVALACVAMTYAANAVLLAAAMALKPALVWAWPPAQPTAFGATIITGGSTILESLTNAEPGLPILACWLLMLAAGRWRPGLTWIDRSGRALGLLWVVAYLFYTLTLPLFSL